MKRAIAVVDLGFGDQGKGTTIDYLSRRLGARTVVRFNGGSQAAHNVHTRDGRWHTFSQFGSASLVPGTRTFYSQHALLNPREMINEAEGLKSIGLDNPLNSILIHENAIVVTPYHQAMNRIKEMMRGKGKHGSCGKGIGEAVYTSIHHPHLTIRASDLGSPTMYASRLNAVREHMISQIRDTFPQLNAEAQNEFERAFEDLEVTPFHTRVGFNLQQQISIVNDSVWELIVAREDTILFEGAQGVLLDQWHGFFPYTTWSDTTFNNVESLLRQANFSGSYTKIGVTRAYSTRHGAGPFVSEDEDLTRQLPEDANVMNRWQGAFRAGWLDLVGLKYALEVVGGVDHISLTCVDRVNTLGETRVCDGYSYAGELHEHLSVSWDTTAPHYLSQKSALTQLLMKSRPRTRKVSSIEDELKKMGLSVGVRSNGRTADHKELNEAIFGTTTFNLLQTQ